MTITAEELKELESSYVRDIRILQQAVGEWKSRAEKAEAELARVNQAFMGVDGGRMAIDDLVSCIVQVREELRNKKDELAALAGQEPAAYRWDAYTGHRYAKYKPNHPERNVTELFTRAAPAVKTVTDKQLQELIRVWNRADFPSTEVYDQMRDVLKAAAPAGVVVPDDCPVALVDFCERMFDGRANAREKAEYIWDLCSGAVIEANKRQVNDE